jgi:hypothetical protein
MYGVNLEQDKRGCALCRNRAAPHAGTRERNSGPGGSAENHGLISGLLFWAPRSSTRRTSCGFSSRTCAAAGHAAHEGKRLPPSRLPCATAQLVRAVCAAQRTHHSRGASTAPASSTRPGRRPCRAAPRNVLAAVLAPHHAAGTHAGQHQRASRRSCSCACWPLRRLDLERAQSAGCAARAGSLAAAQPAPCAHSRTMRRSGGRQQAQLQKHWKARGFHILPGVRASSVVRSGNRSSERLKKQHDEVVRQVACSCRVLDTRCQSNASWQSSLGEATSWRL